MIFSPVNGSCIFILPMSGLKTVLKYSDNMILTVCYCKWCRNTFSTVWNSKHSNLFPFSFFLLFFFYTSRVYEKCIASLTDSQKNDFSLGLSNEVRHCVNSLCNYLEKRLVFLCCSCWMTLMSMFLLVSQNCTMLPVYPTNTWMNEWISSF